MQIPERAAAMRVSVSIILGRKRRPVFAILVLFSSRKCYSAGEERRYDFACDR